MSPSDDLPDRRVHVSIVSQRSGLIEIVRYDRAGKWWRETANDRRQLPIAEAVYLTHQHAVKMKDQVTWRAGLQGGSLFDAALWKVWA